MTNSTVSFYGLAGDNFMTYATLDYTIIYVTGIINEFLRAFLNFAMYLYIKSFFQ